MRRGRNHAEARSGMKAMGMDVVLATGLVAILVVAVWTIATLRRTRRRMQSLREDFERATELGQEPASLRPLVDLDACIGTASCTSACPEENVLGVVDGQARIANPTACIGHGECVRACPTAAIRLVMGSEKRGVEIPIVGRDYQTEIPGLYIVGELGGMGLIYNAVQQGLACMEGIVRHPPERSDGIRQVVIVGAGPAGLAASLAAREAGLDFVTLDRESIGGTILQYPRRKIVMTRPVVLPGYGLLDVKSVRKEALLEAWQDVLARTGLRIRTGVTLRSVRPTSPGLLEVVTDDGVMTAQRVVLAIGRRGTPRKLGIPGELASHVSYRLDDAEPYRDLDCLVVGGGDAAVEAAIALGDAGARVTLVHRRQRFDRIRPANQTRLDDAVKGDRIQLVLGATLTTIRATEIELESEGKTRRMRCDQLFVLIGGELPSELLARAGVGVRVYHGEAYAPAR